VVSRALSIALLCFLLVPAATAAPAADAGRARAKVSFELGARTGFEYRWEYNVRFRISNRTTGTALTGLRVFATGLMNAPGHEMRTVTLRIRDAGAGTYTGTMAFYMPGEWRIRVSVLGANVLPGLASFRVFLQ